MTIRCPQCGTEFDSAGKEFCPNPACGYPISFMQEPEEDTEPTEMVRKPGEKEDGEQPAKSEEGTTEPIEKVPPVQPTLPPRELPPRRSLSLPPAPVLVGILGVVAVVLLLWFLFIGDNTNDDSGTAGDGDGKANEDVELQQIDPGSIAASASSELEEDPAAGSTYVAGNTLDDDATTAWNDGIEGPGLGETLTYRFAESVRLRRIDLLNGYQKNEEVFSLNARIKDLVIFTDSGQVTITLSDSPQPQSFAVDFDTSSVTLRIESVYEGSSTTFFDVGLSEIDFFAEPKD